MGAGQPPPTATAARFLGLEKMVAVLSVLVPFVPHRPEHIVPYAAYVQWSPAHRLWQGQATLVEPFQSFASPPAPASGCRSAPG